MSDCRCHAGRPAPTRCRSTSCCSRPAVPRFDFGGSIGPKPPTGAAGEEPSYRYDLTSDGSTLAPSEVARAGADVPRPHCRRLPDRQATSCGRQIAVRSGFGGRGAGHGGARVRRRKGARDVSSRSTSTTCRSRTSSSCGRGFPPRNARLWVLNNLFGGRVVDGNLQFQVAPGRLGNGVPLSGDEVFGRFQIEGSRFDTAGRIPPVRDAVGVVEFHGNDVDISLSSGTVYHAERPHRGGQQRHADDQGRQPPAGHRRARHRCRGRRAGRRRTRVLRADQCHAPCRLPAGGTVRHGDRQRQGRHSAAVGVGHVEARLAGVARLHAVCRWPSRSTARR